jgi:hypothetical protein
MKKILMVAMTLIIATSFVFAGDKYQKMAKKTAKSMTSGKKEPAWMVAPSAKPLEFQLEKKYRMEDEMNDEGERKWMIEEGRSVAENYEMAKKQALSMAIENLAHTIQSSVAEKIEKNGGNQAIAPDDAATALKMVMSNTQWIQNTIGKVTTLVECYQRLPNKNYCVSVTIAYNERRATDASKQALREALEKEGKLLSSQIDKVVNF